MAPPHAVEVNAAAVGSDDESLFRPCRKMKLFGLFAVLLLRFLMEPKSLSFFAAAKHDERNEEESPGPWCVGLMHDANE